MSDKRVNAKLQLTLTDAQGLMYQMTNEWDNFPIPGVLHIEKKVLEILTEFHQVGQQSISKDEPNLPRTAM